MKRIKTMLRNKMKSDFLADNMIVHIEKELAKNYDAYSIIKDFFGRARHRNPAFNGAVGETLAAAQGSAKKDPEEPKEKEKKSFDVLPAQASRSRSHHYDSILHTCHRAPVAEGDRRYDYRSTP